MSAVSLNLKQKPIFEVTQDLSDLFQAKDALEVVGAWYKTFGIHICQDMNPTQSFDENGNHVFKLLGSDMKTQIHTVYDSIPLIAGSPDDIAAICALDFFAAIAEAYPKMRELVLTKIVNEQNQPGRSS